MGNAYALEYNETPKAKAFFMPHNVSKATKGIINATMLSKPTKISKVIVAII
jgi:hypothetical protein